MIIEVEWEASPKTGLTQIDISELGCNSKKEWDKLSKKEQKSRINNWQNDNEQKTTYNQIDWYEEE